MSYSSLSCRSGWRVGLLGLWALGGLAGAQTSSSVENIGSVAADRMRNGLGFNVQANQEWEFAMAKAAGANEVRWQPGWVAGESEPGKYVMPAASERALDWCANYGLQPLLVAGYAPPFRSAGDFTVAAGVPVGAHVITFREDVSAIDPPYCHVLRKEGKANQIVPTGKWAYYGALIDAVDAKSHQVTLAAATSVALKSGDVLRVNRLFYPGCATDRPDDPSIVAFGKYMTFLAGRIAAHGLKGRVEIWNEPPWAHDPWDCRAHFYDADKLPAGLANSSPNFGFAEMAATLPRVPGVTYNWGGSHKSGARSLLSTRMLPPLTAAEVANNLASESFHPYGNSPEDAMWNPTALATEKTGDWIHATWPGGNWGGNFKLARKLLLERPDLPFEQNITETGCETSDGVRKARLCLRQYLGFLGLGLKRVTFYCFAGQLKGDQGSFGFVDAQTHAPTQAYTAMKEWVVTDLGKLSVKPLPFAASDLATVTAYSGTYPLQALSIVGRAHETDTRNTSYFVCWQRSLVAPGPVKDLRATLDKGAVKLTWSANAFATLADATQPSVVKRATKSGGPYVEIAKLTTQPQMSFTDTSAKAGDSAYYVVTSTNPAGEGSRSNEVAVTASGTVTNDSLPMGEAQASWRALAQPPAGMVTVQLPDGTVAHSAWNLVTRAKVPVTGTGKDVSYKVSDDPVCLEVDATAK